MKAGNNNRLCIREDHIESSSSSNASMRGREEGEETVNTEQTEASLSNT